MNAYDMNTGEPVPRQKNPVRPDSWLMPGGCTEIKPPEFNPETHACEFINDAWVLTEIPQPEPEQEPEPHVQTYADKRIAEYGNPYEQIAFITENGLEAWQTKVASIKEKYPKE